MVSIEFMGELRESLADLEHIRWSRWMDYLFTQGVKNADGSFTINTGSVRHWERQARTPYTDLSEREKDSDRKVADISIRIFAEFNFKDSASHLLPFVLKGGA